MSIREVLISLYEWGRQSAYGNLGDYTPKRTQKVNQAKKDIQAIRHREVPKKKDCAHNKKWQSTYPKDCQNIGFNQAIDQIHAKINKER